MYSPFYVSRPEQNHTSRLAHAQHPTTTAASYYQCYHIMSPYLQSSECPACDGDGGSLDWVLPWSGGRCLGGAAWPPATSSCWGAGGSARPRSSAPSSMELSERLEQSAKTMWQLMGPFQNTSAWSSCQEYQRKVFTVGCQDIEYRWVGVPL